MNKEKRSVIIISASSDIGTALCRRWKSLGWDVCGTFRTQSESVAELNSLGVRLVHCDLSEPKSIRNACSDLQTFCPKWDVLVMCPGAQGPIGPFAECNFAEWAESTEINFSGQMRIVHNLLPFRNAVSALEPRVLFFAGGGTNDAPVNYSAYIVSKIALIKMCELLDAEMPDTCFAIVGPGWVKTKIHNATLKTAAKAGGNYKRTLEKLAGDECTPIEQVLNCCDWILNAPREVVGGRNFSVVFDRWGSQELMNRLAHEPDMYKLRRYGNEWLAKDEH